LRTDAFWFSKDDGTSESQRPRSESTVPARRSDAPTPSSPSASIGRRPTVGSSLRRPITTAPTSRSADPALVIEPMHVAPQPSSSRRACVNGMVAAKPTISAKTLSEPSSTPRWKVFTPTPLASDDIAEGSREKVEFKVSPSDYFY
jgi:hypothetical protein